MIWGLCFLGITMNLLIGSKNTESVIGLEVCNVLWWVIQGIFCVICLICTYLSLKQATEETRLCKKFGGVGLCDSDMDYTSSKVVKKILILGFGGGWAAGALGLGGGSIYNPVFLTLGVHPKVSGSSSMYLILFSTFNSSLVAYLNGILDLEYCAVLGVMSMIGAGIGMGITDWVIEKTGRASIIVWVLAFILILSAVVIPIMGTIELLDMYNMGKSIFGFYSLCPDGTEETLEL